MTGDGCDDSDWLANVPRRSTPPRTTTQRVQPARTTTAREPVERRRSAAASASAGIRQPRRGESQGRRRGRAGRRFVALLVVAVLAVPPAVIAWAELSVARVDALSGAPATPGTTYLIVGSDSRAGWDGDDGIEGERTDTIIVMHRPVDGPIALISLPRDTLVEIPGHGPQKINAAYAFGGAPLLVATVEELSGLTVDHYVEVGFGGVEAVVDALGGVELCLDRDVSDDKSDLEWAAGCHVADGASALAFARMRYSDPLGDIGRTSRQQQLITAVAADASSRDTLTDPVAVTRLLRAGVGAVRVDAGTHTPDLVAAARAFQESQGQSAVTGTPPIATIDHRVDGVGSTVLLDDGEIELFWERIRDGDYPPGGHVGGWG